MSEKVIKDLVIIGGGINGAGIARDASGRGLSVELHEKGDLAQGTSSASSKLIHGGLRYLEQRAFKLVRESLDEREILLQQAPFLVLPQRFILPYEPHLRSRWLLRLGLFIYDHLGSQHSLPGSRKIKFYSKANHQEYSNILDARYRFGFEYYDCTVDDARLVLLNALAAHQNGAFIRTRSECIKAVVENGLWVITTQDVMTGVESRTRARVLINAAGPWVKQVNGSIFNYPCETAVKLVKGSHVVLRKFYEGDQAYILQQSDGRVIFVIPYQEDFLLVGTTDVPLTSENSFELEHPSISDEEKIYLLEIVNRYFNKKLSSEEILWSYAGTRCLLDDGKQNPSAISRDYQIRFNDEMGAPLITVIGGKVTTYRKLAEQVMSRCRGILPNTTPENHWTGHSFLPGGEMSGDLDDLFTEYRHRYAWASDALLRYYIRQYGTRAELLLEGCESVSDLGESLGDLLYSKEVEYWIKYEWAKTLEDILWRRSKFGLKLSLAEQARLKGYL